MSLPSPRVAELHRYSSGKGSRGRRSLLRSKARVRRRTKGRASRTCDWSSAFESPCRPRPPTPWQHSSGNKTGEHCGDELLTRSEEHTSELQSRRDLVCRLLLEKKKN